MVGTGASIHYRDLHPPGLQDVRWEAHSACLSLLSKCAVKCRWRNKTLSLFEQPQARVEEWGMLLDIQLIHSQWISEYVSGRSNIETKHIQGLYLLGIDAIQLGVQSGATEVTAGGSIHCGVIRFLFTIQNTGSPLSPPRVRNVLHRSALGVFAKAKIKYFEFLTQYSSRRSRVKSDRR